MRIPTPIIAGLLCIAAGGTGFWLLSSGKSGSIATNPQKLEAHQALHRQIDQLVVEMTTKYGYTNEAALAIVKKLSEPGLGVSAQLTSSGDIEITVPGEKMSRKILMNKPDLGGGK